MLKAAVVGLCVAVCAVLFMEVVLADCPHTRAVEDLCPTGGTACEELSPSMCSGTQNDAMWGTFGCDVSFYWEETQCADSLCDTAPCYHEANCVAVTIIDQETGQLSIECQSEGPYGDPNYASIKETYAC